MPTRLYACQSFGPALFGAHVGRRAKNHTRCGAVVADRGQLGYAIKIGLDGRRRETEVEHFDHAGRSDLDVGGLEIAVNDTLVVGGSEGISNLACRVYGLALREWPESQTVGERFSVDEFENECTDFITRVSSVRRTFSDAVLEAINCPNVRMIQRSKDSRLTREPPKAIGIRRQFARQNLNGDITPEPRIARLVDLAHPALADLRGDLVCAEPSASHEGHGKRLQL